MNKLKFLYVFELLLICLIWPASHLHAASCCGGSFAVPALIAGDEKAIFTAGYTYSQIKTDVYPDGIWRDRSFPESSETLKLDGAHIFFDRWQTGFSLPLIRRSREEQTSSGLGDISGTVGYEYLPDWDYSPWRPKGIGFIQLTAPSGRSIYEANAPYQIDSRGRGLWALGVGTLLTKNRGVMDFFSNFEIHRSFDRNDIHPGWGGNLGLGAGYNYQEWRTGFSLAWTYEDPVNRSGKNQSKGNAERFATASLSASYMYSEEWSGVVTYSDQTLFGDPINARLGRSVVFQIQKRWSR